VSDVEAARGEPVVELTAVEKVYRDFWGRAKVRALAPLTLSLERGEILALLGPNGAGKSTTIKLILGLLFPTRGRIRVLGGSARDPGQRARLGYLPEETRLHPFLTPRETLDLFGRIHGLDRSERKRRIEQLVTMVGLTHNADRPVGEFSKGMARRIGLAVALVHDPDLLILDEPTSGLDPLGTRDIKDLIQALKARGRSVLLSSHLLDDVEDVADRIAILYGGELRQVGTTHDLLAQSGRIRLELSGEGRDPRQTAQIVADALGAEAVEATVPADRLESLFRRVVEEAEAADAQTAGARRGGGLATFLGGEEDASLSQLPEAVAKIVAAGRAPESVPSEVVTTTGATAGATVEALTPAGEAALDEGAPAPLATPRAPSPVVEALTAAGAAAVQEAAAPGEPASESVAGKPVAGKPVAGKPVASEPVLGGDALGNLLGQDPAPAPEAAEQPRVAGDALNAVLGRPDPKAPLAPEPEAASGGGPALAGDALGSLLGGKTPARVESLKSAPTAPAPAPKVSNPVLDRLLGGEP
jgi:ABC-2 type transport system ATP-binding protein